MNITFNLNGNRVSVSTPPMEVLLNILREELGDTTITSGCRSGICGACLILLDGDLVNACLIPAFRVQGRKVITRDGLMKDPMFGVILKKLTRKRIVTEGTNDSALPLVLYDLLKRIPHPREKQIQKALSSLSTQMLSVSAVVDAVDEITQSKKRNHGE